jgi:phage FluMu protein Com
MGHKVFCPKCNKTLIHYVNGHGIYDLKCNNNKCGTIVRIYSAGKTVIMKDLTFGQLEYLVRSNKGNDTTQIT